MSASYGPQCFAAFAATMGQIDLLSILISILTILTFTTTIVMLVIRELGDGHCHQLDKPGPSSSSEA